MSNPLPGWKLVPVEPTLPMLVAGNKASLDVSVLMDDSSHSCERACYAAMIAAAPSQPQGNADQLTEGGDRRAAHDALPLIDRLRHTPNWMRESYGSWKDCVLTYDRSPFEAADTIEALQAALASAPQASQPPQGASSPLPGWKLVPESLTEDMHAAAVRTIVRCTGNDDFPPRVWRAMLAASPLPAPQEPADWSDQVEQRLLTWRQRFVNKSGDQLALDDFMGQESIDDLIDFVCAPLYAAPAPVDPESQGSQPASPARELTDEEIDEAHNAAYTALVEQGFNGGMGGLTWDRAAARSVIARDRALREQGR